MNDEGDRGTATAADRSTLDPMLAAYLAERDVPCPSCEYNLRGVKANRCPECGHTLTLLDSRPFPSVPYLVGFGALCGLVVILAWAVAWWVYHISSMGYPYLEESWFRKMFTADCVALVLAIAPLVAWLLLRKSILRTHLHVQWLLVAACLTLYPVLFIVKLYVAG